MAECLIYMEGMFICSINLTNVILSTLDTAKESLLSNLSLLIRYHILFILHHIYLWGSLAPSIPFVIALSQDCIRS